MQDAQGPACPSPGAVGLPGVAAQRAKPPVPRGRAAARGPLTPPLAEAAPRSLPAPKLEGDAELAAAAEAAFAVSATPPRLRTPPPRAAAARRRAPPPPARSPNRPQLLSRPPARPPQAFAKDLVRIQPLVLVPEAAGAAAGALLWAALATAPEKRTALRAAPAALRVAAAAAHWVATKALGVRTLAPNAELMARAASVPKAALAAEERALLHTLKWEVAAVLRRAGVARSY